MRARSQRWYRFLKGGPFDPEANLVFGEGGAGAFSDGKLTTRIGDPRVRKVLEAFVECGAPADTLYVAKPHLGSNKLPSIVRRLRQQLIARGTEFRFDTCLLDVEMESGRVTGARVADETLPAEILVLAIGHSARDTLRQLATHDVVMEPKPFQMGVRIEHRQSILNRQRYRHFADHPDLPAAEYQLVARHVAGDGDLFTFCMCPGGEVLLSTETEGLICVNGASRFKRIGHLANSGLVMTIEPAAWGGDPLGGLRFQEDWESRAHEAGGGVFRAPAQRARDFLEGKRSASLPDTTYPSGLRSVPLAEVLPDFLVGALGRGLPELDHLLPIFLDADSVLIAPETRSSSPVRIMRHPETLESQTVRGLYPVGEGAGYAGGIVSAAVDGLRAAEAIAARFAPMR